MRGRGGKEGWEALACLGVVVLAALQSCFRHATRATPDDLL